MKWHETRDEICKESERASRDWFVRQCKNEYAAMYVYYKKGNIHFTISEDHPGEGWELGSAERISPAWTVYKVRGKVNEWAQKWPIL